jgi:hypothetical protein
VSTLVRLGYYDTPEIEELLLGRRVTKVAEDRLLLDDGTELTLFGNEGCPGCSNGRYDLTALNGIDNIITKVTFANQPDDGQYTIFVYAGYDMINLADFEGGDGNGYYGTGYYITVKRPT